MFIFCAYIFYALLVFYTSSTTQDIVAIYFVLNKIQWL